jgi:hypothetical protein
MGLSTSGQESGAETGGRKNGLADGFLHPAIVSHWRGDRSAQGDAKVILPNA